jgi:pyruvate dehydrogenase E2 component (dihydrolipoyllysine-residue acetyltransferase)
MTVNILVPPLSQTLDTLVIVEWKKQVGDPVVKGEALLTVETDKATLEVESPATGVLNSVYAGPGEEVKIKSIIGSIAEPEEAVPTVRATGPEEEPLSPERQRRVFASPRARQLAQLKDVPLAELEGVGTGPGQMIVERDVTAYLEQQEAKPRVTPLARRMAEVAGVDLTQLIPSKPGETIKKADIEASIRKSTAHEISLTPIRKTIARRMQDSHQKTAPVTYMSEVDATRLVKLRKRILKKLPEGAIRPTYTDFIILITCRILARHPALNATFDGETLKVHESIHMALAVDTERGLIVPVIRDAGTKGLEEIARLRRDMVERALANSFSPDELVGGTFTITNLGRLGIDHFTPIINPPQVSILGVGRIRKVPAVHKGKIRIRRVIGLDLTCDHRVIDGAPAARFLSEIINLIENPDLIWM